MFNFQKAIMPTVSVYSNNSVKLAQTTASIIGVSETNNHIFIGKDIPTGKVLIASMTEQQAGTMAGYDVKKLNNSYQINSKYISTLLTGKGAVWNIEGAGQDFQGILFFEMICEKEGTIEVAKAKKVGETVKEEFQAKESEEEKCATVDDVL